MQITFGKLTRPLMIRTGESPSFECLAEGEAGNPYRITVGWDGPRTAEKPMKGRYELARSNHNHYKDSIHVFTIAPDVSKIDSEPPLYRDARQAAQFLTDFLTLQNNSPFPNSTAKVSQIAFRETSPSPDYRPFNLTP